MRLRVLSMVVLALNLAACTSSQAVRPMTAALDIGLRPPLPVVDLAATPAGWVPVAYGDAQVSVPASFSVFYPGQDPCESFSTPGALFVAPIPGFKRICPAPGHPRATLVRLVPYGGVPQKTAGEKLIIVNGVPAYFVPPSSARPFIRYFVPSLGVLVSGSGPMARRVLDTLTCSPRAVALASGGAPAVPSSWRPVAFAGLRFSVPASWPVQRRRAQGIRATSRRVNDSELTRPGGSRWQCT